jgi:hypothetical protein
MLIDLIVKVQKPNIEGLTSFGKKENKWERMKEKRRKNQQPIVSKFGEGITM